MRVFLDMDGVLVDFYTSALKLGCPPIVQGQYGQFPSSLWSKCDEDFWTNLSWMVDGREILKIIESSFGQENVCLLSSPCATHGCMDGKMGWVRRHLPRYKNRILLGRCKDFCAYRGSILFDDCDKNVEAFRAGGGAAWLVPRLWNSAYNLRNDTVNQLSNFVKGLK